MGPRCPTTRHDTSACPKFSDSFVNDTELIPCKLVWSSGRLKSWTLLIHLIRSQKQDMSMSTEDVPVTLPYRGRARRAKATPTPAALNINVRSQPRRLVYVRHWNKANPPRARACARSGANTETLAPTSAERGRCCRPPSIWSWRVGQVLPVSANSERRGRSRRAPR